MRKPRGKLLWVVLLTGPALLALAFAACGSGSSAAGTGDSPIGDSATGPVALQVAGSGQPQGISVSGEGRVSGVPDVAILTLGVSTQAATVQAANAQAQEAMNKLLDALRANGIADKDIQTRQFSISPQYDYRPDRQPQIIGYQVTNMVRVKVRSIDDTGKVIDDAVAAAGDPLQVQGISLTIDDTTALRVQARAEAMADAVAKAEQLASLAGVGLGKPTFISESGGFAPPPVFFRAADELGAPASTPISPGELEVVVTVQVTYAIQ
ncbi:MAG: SIMPL domain-containing protein [Dehalococcoidia bacterium]